MYRSWYQLERFGLALFKRFIGLWQYNNALASFLMVVCFGISAFVWAYLFYGATRDKSRFVLVAFTVPYLTAPIFAEMLGFLLLGPEISVASAMVAVSLMMWSNAVDGVHRNGTSRWTVWGCLALALVLAAAAFSMYLAMVTLFVSGVAMCYFLRYGEKAEGEKASHGFITLGVSIVLFVLAYLGYSLVNRLVMSHAKVETDAYITDQSHWGKCDISRIWTDIRNHFCAMYSGEGIFYTLFFTVFGALFLLLSLAFTVRKKLRVFACVDALLIFIAPMMMTVILGVDPSVRTEMTYQLAFLSSCWFLLCGACVLSGRRLWHRLSFW